LGLCLRGRQSRYDGLHTGLNTFASRPTHRLLCQLLWRDRFALRATGLAVDNARQTSSASEHEEKVPTGFTRTAGFRVSDRGRQGIAHPPRRQPGQVASCQGRPLQNAGTVQTDLLQTDLVVLGTTLHRECPAARSTMRLCCYSSSLALATLSLDFLSQPLRGTLVALALSPDRPHEPTKSERPFR
jgi:hypothetical protein